MELENIKLGEQQQQAFDIICDFIKNSKETAFSLVGAAGTGKSLLISKLSDWIEEQEYEYALCAPTHKAALVMKQYSGQNANTLHRLLALSPNIEILDLDFRQLKFVTSKAVDSIPIKGIIICDEASMINDDLFDLLIEKVSSRDSKIIFVSDSAQLSPVKQQKIAKVYSLENSFQLTKIYRQSEKNALTPILQELREREILKLVSCKGEGGNLIVESEMAEFFNKALSEIKIAINTKNILHTKIAAYTNKRVDLYNQAIRIQLWKNSEEYCIGDIITACENGKCEGYEYWNSMDYIVVKEPELSAETFPNYQVLSGWNLTLYDPYSEEEFTIFILSKDNSEYDFAKLAAYIEDLRLRAIKAKQKRLQTSYMYWRKYYELIESFTTPVDLYYDGRLIRKKSFSYGYACTIHRLQGSSFNNIFVDMRNIKTCQDDLIRRQLQYVALSRTRGDAYVLQ